MKHAKNAPNPKTKTKPMHTQKEMDKMMRENIKRMKGMK